MERKRDKGEEKGQERGRKKVRKKVKYEVGKREIDLIHSIVFSLG